MFILIQQKIYIFFLFIVRKYININTLFVHRFENAESKLVDFKSGVGNGKNVLFLIY